MYPTLYLIEASVIFKRCTKMEHWLDTGNTVKTSNSGHPKQRICLDQKPLYLCKFKFTFLNFDVVQMYMYNLYFCICICKCTYKCKCLFLSFEFQINPILNRGEGEKGSPTTFSPVTFTNIGINNQHFLTFNFNLFATLV